MRMRAHEKGFTLLELIITMGILGVVTAAIFSVYNTQRTVTYVEADVADVQQNLRLSVQSVLKDLRMAGFMLAGGLPPIASAADGAGPGSSDALTINTAAAGGAALPGDGGGSRRLPEYGRVLPGAFGALRSGGRLPGGALPHEDSERKPLGGLDSGYQHRRAPVQGHTGQRSG